MAAQLTMNPVTLPHHRSADDLAPRRRAEITKELLRAAARADGIEQRRLRDEIVLVNLGIAESVARRYRGRGQDYQDLLQVANIGLVKAVQRFDAAKGEGFLAYAVPTIAGEIKRYFRDHAWAVRPPRRIQDLQAEIPAASAELAQSLSHAPSTDEIAQHLGESPVDVGEALASRGCFTPASIDAPSNDDEGASLADLIGADDPGFDRAEAIAVIGPVCRRLPERDQRILFLRFFRCWTQREIADDLGVTQMQVSRLLSAIFRRIRAAIGVPEPA